MVQFHCTGLVTRGIAISLSCAAVTVVPIVIVGSLIAMPQSARVADFDF